MELLIRPMTVQDIRSVQYVATTCWHETYKEMIPLDVQNRFLQRAYNDTMMAQRIQNSIVLVAEKGNEVVGFANFTPLNEEAVSELAAIYILPDAQGLGVGSALLQSGMEQLSGLKTIELTVEKENERGKQFYFSKGFRIVSEFEEDFDGHSLQSIRMELTV